MADIPISNQDLISFVFDKSRSFDRDAPLYIDADKPDRYITANVLQDIVLRLANGFRQAGLKKGDCVCIASFNEIHYPALVLGIIAAGGIFTGSNPSYTPAELKHHLDKSDSVMLIAEPEILDVVKEGAKGTQVKQIFVFDEAGKYHGPIKSWRTLLDHGKGEAVKFDNKKQSQQTTAARLFSSGTTGLPKAANLSHYNLVAQHILVHERYANPKDTPWETRRIVPLPMFHAATVPFCHFTVPRLGQPSYIMRRFELEPFLKYSERYKITVMALVPPLCIAMVMSPLRNKYSLKSVRHGAVGAAPLDKDVQARLLALFHETAYLTQVWGATEVSCVGTSFPPTEADFTGSVGYPLAGSELKLVDDDGKEVQPGQPGELLFKGPGLFQGYHKNDAANESSFTKDGFYITGDICKIDPKNGKLWVVDRKKELIKVRAFQVAPPEVEAVLLAHPEIIDCAVIGVPHQSDGEAVRAYVVRAPGSQISATAVQQLVAKQLSSYKNIKGGVVFLNAIPKSPTGKILKRILRDQAKEEMRKDGSKL